jgi:hypothetical protein
MRDPQFDEMLRFLAELKQGHCGDVKVIYQRCGSAFLLSMRNRIGFFYLNADPDPERKANANPR